MGTEMGRDKHTVLSQRRWVWEGQRQEKIPNEVYDSLQQEHCLSLLRSATPRETERTEGYRDIFLYSPCHVAFPRTRLLDHLTFPFYNGYLVLKKTTAVHPAIYSPQHILQSFSSISLGEPLSTPPLPVIPQEQVCSGRELGREWISLSAHTSTLAWQQQWWHGWGGVPADLFIAEPPSTRSPNAACLPATGAFQSVSIFIT